ncbi:hypothetical protein QQP08_024439 [Theobroma cacao]|nr:hypothetical protein QQP08_024439 [Theobroma cacao]
MGCSFSRGSSSTVKNIIRVVHLNGYVEDFEYPVSVGQLTARKLSAKAKSTNCKAKSPTSSQYSHGSSPLWNSLGRSPNRLRESDSGMKSHGAQSSSRVRTWRPVLDTIREKSFNRRSESDLQET